MAKKKEVLLWPMRFGLEQTRRVGSFSVEATKTVTRRQVAFGQSILRLLDPKEFVTYRRQEKESEKSRQMEIKSIGKDLQGHDARHPQYSKLVRFSAQSMLKLVNQWAEDGSPISKDARIIAEKFLKDNKVPDEIITASLDQLQVERPLGIAEEGTLVPAQSQQPALFDLSAPPSLDDGSKL